MIASDSALRAYFSGDAPSALSLPESGGGGSILGLWQSYRRTVQHNAELECGSHTGDSTVAQLRRAVAGRPQGYGEVASSAVPPAPAAVQAALPAVPEANHVQILQPEARVEASQKTKQNAQSKAEIEKLKRELSMAMSKIAELGEGLKREKEASKRIEKSAARDRQDLMDQNRDTMDKADKVITELEAEVHNLRASKKNLERI